MYIPNNNVGSNQSSSASLGSSFCLTNERKDAMVYDSTVGVMLFGLIMAEIDKLPGFAKYKIKDDSYQAQMPQILKNRIIFSVFMSGVGGVVGLIIGIARVAFNDLVCSLVSTQNNIS